MVFAQLDQFAGGGFRSGKSTFGGEFQRISRPLFVPRPSCFTRTCGFGRAARFDRQSFSTAIAVDQKTIENKGYSSLFAISPQISPQPRSGNPLRACSFHVSAFTIHCRALC